MGKFNYHCDDGSRSLGITYIATGNLQKPFHGRMIRNMSFRELYFQSSKVWEIQVQRKVEQNSMI